MHERERNEIRVLSLRREERKKERHEDRGRENIGVPFRALLSSVVETLLRGFGSRVALCRSLDSIRV